MDDMELMEMLEEMGFDYRLSNKTIKDVEKDKRDISELNRDDFDWSGAYEMAINFGFTYDEATETWS